MRSKRILITAFLAIMIINPVFAASAASGPPKYEKILKVISGDNSDLTEFTYHGHSVAEGFAVGISMTAAVDPKVWSFIKATFAVSLCSGWDEEGGLIPERYTPYAKSMWVKVQGDSNYRIDEGKIADNTGTGGECTVSWELLLGLLETILPFLVELLAENPPQKEWQSDLHWAKAIVRGSPPSTPSDRLQTAACDFNSRFEQEGYQYLTITAESEIWVERKYWYIGPGGPLPVYQQIYIGIYSVEFTVEVPVTNAPYPPSTPSGPTSGYEGTTYSYSTSTTDPNGDSVRYEFDWGDGSTSTTDWYASGVTATASHSWSPLGTYDVKVRAQDSYYEWSDWSPILTATIIGHNVAITSVTTAFPLGASAVYPCGDWYVDVTVTVQNDGNFTESFDVTARYDNNIIGTKTVNDLDPGDSTTLTFTWDTEGVDPCPVVYPGGPTEEGYYVPYTISADASTVPGEVYLVDNHMDDGTVTVRRIGDVNGDGHCKGADLTLFSVSWWLDYGDPYYYPRADFNGDGEVKGPDFTLLAMYWYEYSWTPPPPPGAARVYVDPVTVTADVGETFTVSVKVMNVTDLYSWSVGLQWDPAVLECIGASYIDTFLPDSAEYPNKYLDIEGEVNNTAGMIHPPYSRSLSYPNVAGINGNGTLMTATFQVKERGETWINLTEVYLYNTTEAGEIPLEVEGAYVRPGWISPTGHEEGIGWTNPANVYDGVIATTTVSPSVEGNDWTTYLVLNHSAITSNKIRFWQDYSEYISVLQIDVFKDGDWVNVFEASPPDTDMDWTEATYDPGLVTKARIRAKGTAQEEECYLEIQEFEFWEILG